MTGWAGETTLDVEMAHAVAPDAKIVLVETAVAETEGTTGLPEMMDAEKHLIDHGVGDVIARASAPPRTLPRFRQGRLLQHQEAALRLRGREPQARDRPRLPPVTAAPPT